MNCSRNVQTYLQLRNNVHKLINMRAHLPITHTSQSVLDIVSKIKFTMSGQRSFFLNLTSTTSTFCGTCPEPTMFMNFETCISSPPGYASFSDVNPCELVQLVACEYFTVANWGTADVVSLVGLYIQPTVRAIGVSFNQFGTALKSEMYNDCGCQWILCSPLSVCLALSRSPVS